MSRQNLDDNLARRMRHTGARYSTVELTLTGEYSVGNEGGTFHFLDPGASNRTVRMPPLDQGGGQFHIIMNVGAANDLNVVTFPGVAISSIGPGLAQLVISSPSGWRTVTRANSAPATGGFIVDAAIAEIANERVATDSATIAWDFSIPGQARLNTLVGGGNVSNVGSPNPGDLARWTTPTTIESVSLAVAGIAPIVSPTFTGDPKAPTPATGDNDTSIATTAYVKNNLANFQPLDTELTALAGVTAGADLLPYFTGFGSADVTPFTAAARALLDDASAAAMLTTLGAAPLTSPIFIGDPQAPTPTVGDNDTSIATTAFVQAAVAGLASVPKSGRLLRSTATVLSFLPFAGDRIKINGVIQAIPTSGITGLGNTGVFVNGVGGQNLAAATVYLIFAFSNAGTPTADFVTFPGTRATSLTAGNVGTEIRTGNDTRTLIGMIRTNASSQFVDTLSQRFVRSWFNDPTISAFRSSGSVGTVSGSFVEFSSSFRAEFLSWAGENVVVAVTSQIFNNTDGVAGFIQGWVDGVSATSSLGSSLPLAGQSFCIGVDGTINTLAEGYHWANVAGATSGGFLTLSTAGCRVTCLGSGV